MSSVDFLVKLRDGAQMMADAANEYLEKLAPKDEAKHNWNPSKIPWVLTQGSRGPYEKASAEETSVSPDFVALLEDLKAHGGKLQREGWFYWKFDKATTPTVGRKKRK